MANSDFPLARLGFFLSFVAFAATGYYAYSLREKVDLIQKIESSARNERDTANAKAVAIGKELETAKATLNGCQESLGATQTRLEEAQKSLNARSSPTRKRRN